MEKEFFTWDGWDKAGSFSYFFYNCKLVKDIGEHKIGECFETIFVDFENGILEIYERNDEVISKYKIGLCIQEKV